MTPTLPENVTMIIQPERSPGEAVAEDGYVLLDGPDGVALSMTPEAAEETGRRLIAAAAVARRQAGGTAAG